MSRILSLLSMLLLLGMGSALHAQTAFNAQSTNNEAGANPKIEEDGCFIPNAFTPNDDGVNDVFYIPEGCYTRAVFAVYDRWGNQVFFADNPSFRWNGQSAGRDVPQGVYVYTMTGATARKNDVKRTGTITIVR